MIKAALLFPLLLLIAASGIAQSLTISNFRSSYNFENGYMVFQNKGFEKVKDSAASYEKQYDFKNANNTEHIVWKMLQDAEGNVFLTVHYYLTKESDYRLFTARIKKAKFKYSPRNKRYQLPTSSYSGENIYLIGSTIYDGKKYFEVKYTNYTDKALSPLPFESPLPVSPE